MYYIKGWEESISAIQLATKVPCHKFDLSDEDTKQAYIKLLQRTSIIKSYGYFNNITIVDFNGLKNISPDYCAIRENHFNINSQLLNSRLNDRFFHDALERLSQVHPQLFSIANFVIKIIVINQLNSHTNGTTADMLGVVCMDFKDHFESNDFIEDVIHQTIHTLLFLDNFNQPHMIPGSEEIMLETGLKFVLGGTMFPAYLAFHTYLVGVEILYFRMNTFGLGYTGKYHGDTSRIFRVCDAFRKCMVANMNLFSARGQSHLNDSFILLDNIHSIYVAAKNG